MKTFDVHKASQAITFEAIAPKNKNDVTELSATSSSGLPVSFEVVSGPGAITGNTLIFTDEGEVTIKADQPGDQNYLAAEPLEQPVLVYADDTKRDGIMLIVHPNPTKGKLKVKVDNKKDKEYSFIIYNERGLAIESTVIAKSHTMFDVDFDLSQHGDGIYYLWVSDGMEAFVRRIIKN